MAVLLRWLADHEDGGNATGLDPDQLNPILEHIPGPGQLEAMAEAGRLTRRGHHLRKGAGCASSLFCAWAGRSLHSGHALDREYWAKKLREAEAELEAATTRTAVNAAGQTGA